MQDSNKKTMGAFKADSTVRTIFGDKAYKALVNLLDPCCGNGGGCCPGAIYTLYYEFVECDPDRDQPTYTISFSSSSDVSGTVFISLKHKSGSGQWLNIDTNQDYFIFTDGIEKDTEYTLIEGIVVTASSVEQFAMVDSKGNWSEVLSFTSGSCE